MKRTNTIELNNLDSEIITIDTYQMFNGDSFIESELENFREDGKSSDYDSYDWKFNHDNIVRDLANNSINIILQAIKHEPAGKIILDIDYVKSQSPKFYNHTTDSYIMRVTYDVDALAAYCIKHEDEIKSITDTYIHADSPENITYAGLVHLLNETINEEDYKMAMWEVEWECYAENVEITPIKTDNNG